ncbi:glucosyl-3-phosphoglycerate synthase [Streptomyces sp. WM6373]|nr:glucosyl-3-phosphoglycerate synthase [Streptomyces sp. WM6373]KOU61573.1 glucosyl-3-phosphoglycerate synthase [Streptomyces sp. IGB124]KOU71402.1 glucosyl-3-phosphoglycerate synthase [Streptomyces sp. XY66]KOU82666.1 glucosyl-3-phosphoglycerate synthase [Streptomyces sp. XY58]KOV03386.1 glucosyl-3-phosphoglycerate synthase [Streptomyces sp. XY37]KOV18065.1 glucosyl-3-phosphoglycerate synthase [Streptomyces sp. XY413]KOV43644.1 glucosyl-3-phosphoglycerate synthase [Streptomyces sp. MMG1064]
MDHKKADNADTQGVLRVLEEVERWLADRSWSAADRPLDQLLDLKRAAGTTVSVVLPALDEEATVGAIVEVIRRELIEGLPVPLVDELVVIDSGSADRTAEVAAKAGARVVHRDEILPRIPALPGKGEVLWRSLLATTGDIVCFVDADLRDFSAAFVSGIVGPLLTDPGVQFVKAMYDRPLGDAPGQGGRVTELVARPLLNLHWPQLAGFVQPLGGEYAVRRSLLERLPFPVGYGVELGLLVDALHTVGLDALAQVDVGVRLHRHQDGQALGRMAAAIYRTAQVRLSRGHLVRPELTQFERGPEGFVPRTYAVDTEERPPMRGVQEYGRRHVA